MFFAIRSGSIFFSLWFSMGPFEIDSAARVGAPSVSLQCPEILSTAKSPHYWAKNLARYVMCCFSRRSLRCLRVGEENPVLGLLRRPPTATELFWQKFLIVLDVARHRARKFPPLLTNAPPPCARDTLPPPAIDAPIVGDNSRNTRSAT